MVGFEFHGKFSIANFAKNSPEPEILTHSGSMFCLSTFDLIAVEIHSTWDLMAISLVLIISFIEISLGSAQSIFATLLKEFFFVKGLPSEVSVSTGASSKLFIRR